MASLVSPFGNGTIEERHQTRLRNDAADAAKKTVKETNEILVSIVTDLNSQDCLVNGKHVTKYNPLFETQIHDGMDSAIQDICDSVGWILREDLSNEETVEYLNRSFILTRQTDGRYVKSDLILFIRKNMMNHEFMIYNEDGDEVGYIDDILNDLSNAAISAESEEEPDINDCRDVTLDNGFGKM